jgi:hypothetical protein
MIIIKNRANGKFHAPPVNTRNFNGTTSSIVETGPIIFWIKMYWRISQASFMRIYNYSLVDKHWADTDLPPPYTAQRLGL